MTPGPEGELPVFDAAHHAGLGGGNALRAGVLGANDGLVSNLSLVMGVAGASLGADEILITGLAGLLAGACSMAMGEWISVQSSRELYARQLEEERREIRDDPEHERSELIRLYQSRGVDRPTARLVADAIMADPEQALDVMAREELGFDPSDLGGSPNVAAASSFGFFVIGALPPVLPFVWLAGDVAVAASISLSSAALLATGALTTRFTGRSPIRSALRQLAFGLGAAAVTYAVGSLIGVAVA